MCHCLDCQRRTGSVFGVQARFADDQITVVAADTLSHFTRTGDTGGLVTTRFCSNCATSVFWQVDKLPGFTMVGVGCFADPQFGAPVMSVYEDRRHPWTRQPPEMECWD
jgi:hypothetical protein